MLHVTHFKGDSRHAVDHRRFLILANRNPTPFGNGAKLDRAIQRLRRDGAVRPPVVVRRVRDGYLLLDGLYRLRAAQAVGMEQIAARIDE